MIKHQVDKDTRDRDIKPHWQSPSRQRSMPLEISTKCPAKRHDHKRYDDDGENCVCRQNRKVDRTRNSLAGKARSPVMLVIGDIGNQKNNRRCERRHLTVAMRDPTTTFDEVIAG